jgi:hypothetical protein
MYLQWYYYVLLLLLRLSGFERSEINCTSKKMLLLISLFLAFVVLPNISN